MKCAKKMTERKWLRCADPGAMLRFVGDQVSERKIRLFSAGCFRRLLDLLAWDPCWWERLYQARCAVQASELYADGLTDLASVEAARERISFDCLEPDDPETAPVYIAWLASDPRCNLGLGCVRAAHLAAWCAGKHGGASARTEARFQAGWLRDLVGNPFEPVSVDPYWLAWNDGVIPKLAEAAYQRRVLGTGALCDDGLVILADALEEAGCADQTILDHLRVPAAHLPGCWLIDLLTGRA